MTGSSNTRESHGVGTSIETVMAILSAVVGDAGSMTMPSSAQAEKLLRPMPSIPIRISPVFIESILLLMIEIRHLS